MEAFAYISFFQSDPTYQELDGAKSAEFTVTVFECSVYSTKEHAIDREKV